MNRSTDTSNSASDLPGFLSSDEETTDNTASDAVTTEDETTYYEDAQSEEDASDEHASDEVDDEGYDEDDYDDTDVEDESDSQPRARRTTARSTRSRQAAPSPAGGGMMLAIGWLAAIAGVALAFVPETAAAMSKFIEPQILIVLGVALVAIASGKRRTSLVQQRLELMEAQQNDADDELRDMFAEFVQNTNTNTNVSGEVPDAQQMMLSLQRQDQKINNLTKAIKMYGKPLMEIAGQGTELAGSVAQVKSLVEGAAESTRQAVNRVEQQVRSSSDATDLGDLPQQIGKLEVSLAAMAQRLEDSEVRKSLVRLEDMSKELGSQLEDLSRGEAVKTSATELQDKLDKATTRLSESIAQLRDGNVSGLESSVRDIQRELAGLATGMSQVQAAVKNGVKASGGAAAAATQPSAQPSGQQSTPAAAAASGTAAAANAPAAPSGDNKKSDGGGYATGERKVASKNVLGAIAKLKQMKG